MESSDNTLTWLHVSDLHCESEDRFNRKVVIDAFLSDIKSLVTDGLKPDFVAFTGDVAYHGTTSEYEIATREFFEPLLLALDLPRERLFIVPGNHDINRRKTSLLKNISTNIRTADDIRKMLDDQHNKEVILSPLAEYRTFVRSLLPDFRFTDGALGSFQQIISKGGFRIHILGLNSAWLSGFNTARGGAVEDMGKLAIGEIQLHMKEIGQSDLTIALVHHPFEWLLEIDRNVVEHRLSNTANIILRGHLHRADLISLSSTSGKVVIIPCGSIFDSRHSPNAYNIVQINLRTGEGTAYLRRFNSRRNEWQKDTESTGDQGDGQVLFRVPKFWWAAAVSSAPQEPSRSVRNYACAFTEECRLSMKMLGLDQERVLDLIDAEFVSHVNYFRFDLEDYPMPTREDYIIYLDKVGERIEFRRVAASTHDQAQLASWNDILSLYRQATRMVYREEPSKLILENGMVSRVARLHLDLRERIRKHFQRFENISIIGILNDLEQTSERARGIAFHYYESDNATDEAYEVIESMDLGDISQERAVSTLTSSFERSLQHLHKLLLKYSPLATKSAKSE